MTLTLPAGRHTIGVIYGGEDPPRTRKSFAIDLGQLGRSPFLSFTKN